MSDENKVTKMEQQRDVAPATEQASSADMMLQLAIERDVDVDKLERLIAMRDRELLRQAQQRYDEAFSEMLKEYVPVHKDTSARDEKNDRELYKYAPIETILRTYAPIWTKHGFSWTWEEKPATVEDSGGTRRALQITCVVNGHGYEKRYPVVVEVPAPTRFTNSVQVTGIAKTYGRRYSLIDAFSPIIEGEDDDARELSADDALEYAEEIKRLRSCTASDKLREVGKEIHDKLKADGDHAGAETVLAEYNRLKAQIQRVEQEAPRG